MKQSTSPQSLLQQIAQIQRMEPGKLCVIRQGPKGPYYNLQCREHGQPHSQYVRAGELELVRLHTANYERFRQLVTQYAELIVEQTRAERAAGAKKKRIRHPRSSWPKTRKSSK